MQGTSKILNMWYDQGEWITCRQFSILIFQYKSLVHLKCYILIQIPSQSDMWFLRYEQFFNFRNNVKHKNSSPLLACNSKSIFPTSDSFPLIMSHMWIRNGAQNLLSSKISTFTSVLCKQGQVRFMWHMSLEREGNTGVYVFGQRSLRDHLCQIMQSLKC